MPLPRFPIHSVRCQVLPTGVEQSSCLSLQLRHILAMGLPNSSAFYSLPFLPSSAHPSKENHPQSWKPGHSELLPCPSKWPPVLQIKTEPPGTFTANLLGLHAFSLDSQRHSLHHLLTRVHEFYVVLEPLKGTCRERKKKILKKQEVSFQKKKSSTVASNGPLRGNAESCVWSLQWQRKTGHPY